MTEASVWRLITRGTWYVLAAVAAVAILLQVRSVVVQAIVAMIISAAVTPIVDKVIQSRMVQSWRWKPGRVPFVLLLYLVLAAIALVLAVVSGRHDPAATLWLARHAAARCRRSRAVHGNHPAQHSVTASPRDPHGNCQPRVWLCGRLRLGPGGRRRGHSGRDSGLVFVFILAVYFAADGEHIQGYLLDFVPDQQPEAARVMNLSGLRLGGVGTRADRRLHHRRPTIRGWSGYHRRPIRAPARFRCVRR